jgi:hypothetical protein
VTVPEALELELVDPMIVDPSAQMYLYDTVPGPVLLYVPVAVVGWEKSV